MAEQFSTVGWVGVGMMFGGMWAVMAVSPQVRCVGVGVGVSVGTFACIWVCFAQLHIRLWYSPAASHSLIANYGMYFNWAW